MNGIFIVPHNFVGWFFLVLVPYLLWDVFISSKKPLSSGEFLFNNRSFNATKLLLTIVVLNIFSRNQGGVLTGFVSYWLSQLLLLFELFLLIYYYSHSFKKLTLFGLKLSKLPVYSAVVFFILSLVWILLGNRINILTFPFFFYLISLLILLVHYIKRPKNVD